MGIIKKAIIRAQINDLGLYSKAEDVAKKMRQKKGRGDDIERFFRKQGVKAEEMEALGLNDLFRQERVTQQEILDRIDQNRVVMEENVSTGPSEGSFVYGYDGEDLSIEEAYGPEFIESEIEFYLDDMSEMFLTDSNIEDLARKYSDDQEEFEELVARMDLVANGEAVYSTLPYEIVNDLRDSAENYVRLNYDEDPVRRITVDVQDERGNLQNIGDMDGAAFSYSLVGNEDMGFGVDGLERGNIPPNIVRQIDDAGIYSPEEVVIQLRAIAEEYDDMQTLGLGETRHAEYTLDEGENYQEARLSLPSKGETKFREGAHFPDDINNVFHIRTKDREGPLGTKILYVEEVQSDWAQQGRKKGFKSQKKLEEAEAAAGKLLDEAVPLLTQIKQSNIFEDGRKYGNSFLGSVGSLADALSVSTQANRSLDAAGEIVTALKVANRDALAKANNIIQENYLETLSPQQKIDIYVGQVMGDFGATRATDALLQQVGPEEARRIVEAEARDLAVSDEAKLDAVVLKYGSKQGLLPDYDVGLIKAIPANENFNKVLQQVLKEQRSFLESKGIDPMLYPKLRVILDKVDPEGAKLRAEQEQRDLPSEGPFVLDTDSWNKLAVKYIFKKAAEEGYDGVSFAPSDVHVDRWGDEGLRVQYDQNIPRAINSVLGLDSPKPERRPPYSLPYPTKIDDLQQYFAQLDAADKQRIDATAPSNRPDTMEVEGYESKVYFLDDLTKDGESIYEKMKDPTTMFGFAPLPLMLPQGIAGLQGLSPEQAEEQERKVRELERTFPDAMPSESSGILGALKGAGEVAYEGLSDLVIEPFMGMSGAEAAFEMGATPEEAEAARRKAIAMVDFETSSPTGRRYKETVKGGLGALGDYLMGQGEMGRTRSGMPLGPSRDPAQLLFQEALVPAAEAVTEGALGIIGLDPRDTAEMERVRQEAARPFIEAVQPI
jgi:hypothetical protein